jgi:hypothetical protein
MAIWSSRVVDAALAGNGHVPESRRGSEAVPAWCIELGKWPYHTGEWKQWLADTRAGKNSPLPSAP